MRTHCAQSLGRVRAHQEHTFAVTRCDNIRCPVQECGIFRRYSHMPRKRAPTSILTFGTAPVLTSSGQAFGQDTCSKCGRTDFGMKRVRAARRSFTWTASRNFSPAPEADLTKCEPERPAWGRPPDGQLSSNECRAAALLLRDSITVVCDLRIAPQKTPHLYLDYRRDWHRWAALLGRRQVLPHGSDGCPNYLPRRLMRQGSSICWKPPSQNSSLRERAR